MNTFQESNARQLIVIAFGFLVAAGLFIMGLMDRDLGVTFVTKGSYYIILLMTLFWAVHAIPFFCDSLKGRRKEILLCLLLTVAVFVSVPPKYRVLSDETNLLSVSQSMTYKKEISNVTQAKYYYNNFNPVQGDLPTRPLLFPFLTSLVHTVAGYHYQNVFVLNFIILFALLTLAYLVVEPKLGRWSAISTCLLLLAIPDLTLSASSGGFDVCSLFFFALSFVLLYRFLVDSTTENFALLLIQLIMLAQIRYESIAYVAIILGGLFVLRKIRWEMITKNALLFAASPLFLIPMLLQRKYTPNTYENPPGVPPFAFDHFVKHAKSLFDGMVYFRPEYPYPTFLNWLAILLLVVLVVKVVPKVKEYLKPHQMIFTGLLLSCVGLSLTIVLCHHFGVFPHPTQARLFLIFLVFLATIPVVFRYFFPNMLSDGKLFVIAAVSLALYHPVATESRFTNSLTLVRETEDIYDFLKKLNDPRILIIAERPGQLTVANYGAVGFGYANANHEGIINDLSRSLFSDVWIFQKHDFSTGKPVSDQALNPTFQTEPVKDFMVSATEFVRISKLKHALFSAKPEKLQEAAPEKKDKLRGDYKKIFDAVKFK